MASVLLFSPPGHEYDSSLLTDHSYLFSIKLINLQPTYTMVIHPLITRTLFQSSGPVLTCLTISSIYLPAIILLLPSTLCYSPHLHLLGFGLYGRQHSPFGFCFNKTYFYYCLCPVCGLPLFITRGFSKV